MMRRTAPLLLLATAACSQSFPVILETDEPVSSALLILNRDAMDMTKNANGTLSANWGGADADGTVDIYYPDFKRVTCRVGYMTGGMKEAHVTVNKRKCSVPPQIAPDWYVPASFVTRFEVDARPGRWPGNTTPDPSSEEEGRRTAR